MTAVETALPGPGGRSRRFSLPDGGYRGILAAVALLFAALAVWFLISIVIQAKPAFSTLGFSWIVGKTWNPSHNQFGLLPFILGTIEATAIAVALAVPIGLGTAIALAFLVPQRVKAALSTTVELLESGL